MKNQNIFLREQGREAKLGVILFSASYATTGHLIPGIF